MTQYNEPVPGRSTTRSRVRPRRGLQVALGLWALLAMALLLFSRVLGDTFLSDDFGLLRGLQKGGPLGVLTSGGMFFRPLAALSLWLDWRMFGLRATGFHVVNVLLHTAATVALWGVGRRLQFSRLSAGLAALWFFVSPTHSETVAWVACRMDLLATSAGLLGVWAWLAAQGDNRTWRRGLAVVLLGGALLSKEAAAPLCLVVAAWELRTLRGATLPAVGRAARWRILAAGALLAAYLVVRRLALGQWVGGYGQVHMRTNPAELGAQGLVYTVRALTGHLPAEYIPFGRPLYGVLGGYVGLLKSHPVLLGCLAVAGAALLCLAVLGFRRLPRARTQEPIGFALLAYALTMLPVLSLRVSLVSVEGERFLYLPSAFLLLAVSALLARMERFRLVVAGIVTAVYVGLLQVALTAWHDASTLTAELLPEIAAASRQAPVTLINVPDNVRGAYVFRNGLGEALFLLYGLPTPPQVVVGQGVLSTQEPVYIARAPERLTLTLGDPRSWIFAVYAQPGLAAVGEPSGQNQVTLAGRLPARSYVYSAGHIRPLAP